MALVHGAEAVVFPEPRRLTMHMFLNTARHVPVREPETSSLQVGAHTVSLTIVRNPRARRYLLRLRPDGTARVTIPRGGSRHEAQSFLDRHRDWLAQQIQRLQARPRLPTVWAVGTEILFRGTPVRIAAAGINSIQIAQECVPIADVTADLRPPLERHLRALAARELPPRVLELAAPQQLPVRRVTVRNQRSRWGSCSRRGTISLNWRLIQTPDFVRDYIIYHELAHLREMNHSDRFWREVAALCPPYREAERWLKANRQLMREA
jgi:hypothetical protein